ncbi:TPA: hypothetical protein R4X42_000022 [Citrobacter farmeri]|uniref:hypothetical protein n=1 Tax=Citrobacter amalonaticus TaxID=35703 RepID=UPI001E2D9C55|nr:hypothetical protein [Citrobacter amalonaticus]GJK86892.1 hypothetical protein TUM17567_31870 [Citrobacter amalonaticus]HED1900853.1 hypothetical protein [Citrobacter farmeri]
MDTPFELELTESFFYSIDNNPSIKEIVESLQGWETIIKQSKGILAELTGSDILDIEVRVQKLEVGSLTEKILIKLGFGTEEEFDRCLENLHAKVIGDGKMRSALLWLILGAVLATTLYEVVKVMSPDNAPQFQANNNTIINIGAGETTISPERIQAIVDSTTIDKKAVARGAIKVLAPARNDENAKLIIGSDNQILTIPSEIIKKTPTDIEFPPDIYTREHRDVDLEIRATDLDHPEKGWAAVIPGIVDRRVKLVLAPSIDPNELKQKYRVRADVTITYKHTTSKSNPYKPAEIFLSSLVTDE